MAGRMNDLASRKAIRDMAQRITGIEQRVKGLSKPRLVNASIENTAVDSYDADGNLMAIIGRQYDEGNGIISVNGPAPPKPGLPALSPVPTGVFVDFNGVWADGGTTVAPSDFSHFEVHASTDVGDIGIFFSTLRGQIASARGGKMVIPASPDQPLYVWIVARSVPGKFTIGDPAGPTAGGLVTQDAIDVDWEELGGSTIFYGPATPTTTFIGDLWFKSVTVGTRATYEARRWDGDSWELVADQGIAQAFLEAEAAQAAATLRARLYVQPTAPTGLGAADKGIWVDDDDGNRSYTWDGAAWVSRRIGNGAIEPNSLIASNVIATGTVTAALFEAVLILASTIVAGSATAAHVEIDSRGVILFALGPDGLPAQSGALGTGDDGLTFTDPATGVTKTSVTRLGIATPTLDVVGTDEDGDGQGDTGFRVYGREFLDYINELPRGLVASATYFDASGVIANGITAPEALGELSFTARMGRSYQVMLDGLQVSSSSGRIRSLVQVRGTEGGVTPTVSNGVTLESHFTDIPTSNEGYALGSFTFDKTWSTTADTEVRMILVLERFDGATAGSTLNVRSYTPSDRYFAPMRWSVSDNGPTVTDTFLLNNGFGDTNSGGTASPVAKKKYTTTWQANWEASFDSSGKRSDTDLYQGSYGSYTGARGLAGFTGGADYSTVSGELGKTIVQAIGSATVTAIEYKLHCNHTFSYSGGTAKVGYHGQVTEPGSVPAAAYEQRNLFFKRGDTRWIPIGSANYADWKNGTHRGITVGPTGDYMRFAGVGTDRPAIRITYTR